MTREEAIAELKLFKGHTFIKTEEAIDMAIEALKKEPFINKPCVSEKVCEHDKQMVLDKIMAEIDREYKWLMNTRYTIHDVNIAFGYILGIIDRYRSGDDYEIVVPKGIWNAKHSAERDD